MTPARDPKQRLRRHPGRHPRGTQEAPRAPKASEGSGRGKVDRRLQPNAKVPFIFSILRGVCEGRDHELSIFTANNDAR